MGWVRTGKRLRIPTTSQHHQRLNLFGWVAPLLGRQGLMRWPQGNREGFLNSLKQMYRRLQGHTIWLYVDRARWHRGEEVDLFVQTHKRLRLYYLPPYQPGLNLQERIWRQVRYEATTNRWFDNLDLIWDTVQRTTQPWSPNKIKRLCKII
jgi:transposase